MGWMQPVLTLLNRQFSGIDELSGATLQSLGLTSGTCLIRVAHVWTPLTTPPEHASLPAAFVAPLVKSSAAPEKQATGNNDNNDGNSNNETDTSATKSGGDSNTQSRPSKSQKTLEESEEAAVVDATVPADRNVVVFEPNDNPFNPAKFEIPGLKKKT